MGVSRSEEVVHYLEQLGRTIEAGFQSAPLAIFLEITSRDSDGRDGFALLRWIRGTPALSSSKAVILTSSRDPAHIDRARALGASGYVIKHPAAAAMRKWLLDGFQNGPSRIYTDAHFVFWLQVLPTPLLFRDSFFLAW